MVSRFSVTIEFDITAHNVKEALEKAGKLADSLNKKDPAHRAWIPRMIKRVDSYASKKERDESIARCLDNSCDGIE